MNHRKCDDWLKIAAAKPNAEGRPVLQHVHQGRMAGDGYRLHVARNVPYSECNCENYPQAQAEELIDLASRQPTRVRVSVEHLATLAAVAAKMTAKPYHALELRANGALIGAYRNDDLDGTCEIKAGDTWSIGPRRRGIKVALPVTYEKTGPDATVNLNARYLLDALSVFSGNVVLVLGSSNVLIWDDDYAALLAQVNLKRSQ